MYSKEIAKELTKIAVVLPGAPVSPGDIIHFPFGRRGVWPFRKPAPQGAFEIVSKLSNLNVIPQLSPIDSDGDPYIFSSRKSVKVDVNLGGQGNAGQVGTVNGNLKVSFESEGAIYFAAIDCKTTSITNLDQIQVDLQDHTNDIVWNETFLVTSITVASKALIMQSSTNSALLDIAGDIKGLVTGNLSDISANANIRIERFKEASLIKPWSDNVTVFFGLHRFTKDVFGSQSAGFSSVVSSRDFDANQMAKQFVNSNDDRYYLKPVSAFEIFDDNNE